MFITFGLAITFYGEPFLFWEHALSDLGCTVTRQGNPNVIPRLIFTLGMLDESFVMLSIWAQYSAEELYRNQAPKRVLALLGAAGFLVSILPNDRYHVIHSVGVGSSVAALYFFSMLYHFELKEHLSSWQFYLDVALLQIAVFSYAVSFFADWASKQSYQKICIMGVFYVLLKAVSVTKESFAPGEIFNQFPHFRQ